MIDKKTDAYSLEIGVSEEVKEILDERIEQQPKVEKSARREIEALLGTKVYMDLWVKVKENWRDSVGLLRNFGFTNE